MKRLNKGKPASKRLILKHKANPKMLKKLALALVITLVAATLYVGVRTHTRDYKNQVQLEQTRIRLDTTKQELQKQIKEKGITDEKSKKQIEDLNKQLQDTQKQLESKRSVPTVYAEALPVVQPHTSTCGDPKSCIYSHESGGSTTAKNSIGCRGLGQACPGDKLPCGDDYACQDAYFTNYAITRYGSWDAAWAFWQAHSWW